MQRIGAIQSTPYGIRACHAQANKPMSHSPLKFGLNTSSVLLPFAEAISEDPAMQFIAMDMIALWLPRAYISAVQGMSKYNPKEDPGFKPDQMTNLQQFLYLSKQYIKSLNIDYFAEELGREITAGPGMILIPVAGFATAMGLRQLGGGDSFKLPIDFITAHKDTLASGLKHGDHQLKEQELRQLMRDYVFEMFKLSPQELVHPVTVGKTTSTLKHAIETYAQAWSQYSVGHALHDNKPPHKKSLIEAINHASANLIEHAQQFNAHPPQGVEWTHIENRDALPIQLVQRDPKLNQPLNGTLGKAQLTSSRELTKKLNAMKDFWVEVYQTQSKHQLGFQAAAEKVLRRVEHSKFWFVGAITLVSSAYLVALTEWLQGMHKTYPGHKGMRLSDITKSSKSPVPTTILSTPPQSLPSKLNAGSVSSSLPGANNAVPFQRIAASQQPGNTMQNVQAGNPAFASTMVNTFNPGPQPVNQYLYPAGAAIPTGGQFS
jgi:hypothetical protein